MMDKNINEYYFGSIFKNGEFVKTLAFKLMGDSLINCEENLIFKLGQEKIDYSVVNGIICYNNIELRNVVSLSFLKMFYGNDDIKIISEKYNKTMDLKKKLVLGK